MKENKITSMKRHNFNQLLKRGIFLLLVLMMQVGIANAQSVKISGTVTDGETGEPLPGVAIVFKGTSNGTITDFSGNYSIKGPQTGILQYSFIGFDLKEIPVEGKVKINAKLKPSSIDIDEVVAIGYGTQKKKEITGAVVQVKSEELAKTTTSDLGTALQGQIAGVSVTASSGQPGAEANILIRGFSSIMDGNNQPLYVVDGIPYDGDPKLSISEIESMDVLKDAASASIYGTRGAGGVILITTKQGKKGLMTVSVNSEYGVQHITSQINTLSPSDDVYVQLIQSEQNTPDKELAQLTSAISNNKSQFTNNTDIGETILQDWASVQNHSINISGGKDGLTYNFTTNYFGQDGVLIGSKYNRFNTRANTQFTKGKWKITTSLGFRRDEQDYSPSNVLTQIYRYHSYQPEIDPNAGSLVDSNDNSQDTQRLGGVAKNILKTDQRVGNNHFGNMQVDLNIRKDLKFTVRGGANFTDNTRVQITPDFKSYNGQGEEVPTTPVSSNKTISDTYYKYTGETMLNYRKKFNKVHSLNIVVAASIEETSYSYFSAKREEQASDAIYVLDNYTGNALVESGQRDYEQTLIGTLGRAQYNYKGKYLVSGSIRRDGSSQFAEENRWGWFPSASLGWNVSDENFWDPIKSVINSFKVRASYGETGNDRFTRYTYTPVIETSQDYVFGSGNSQNISLGSTQLSYANEQVQWETSVEQNIGIDLNFFRNKLQWSNDIYKSEKRDLLFQVVQPPSTGVSGGNRNVVQNVGNMENKGIESALSYRHKGKRGFGWNAGVTFTKNINEITKTSPTNPFIYLDNSWYSNRVNTNHLVSVITEGYEAGAFFVYQTDGIIQNEEQLAAYKEKMDPSENPQLGEMRYIDQNGDGLIDENDKTYVGSGLPDFEIGLNFSMEYKSWDFSMQWFGSWGAEIMNGGKAYAYQSVNHQDLVYAWSPQNPNTDVPRNIGAQTESYMPNSDYYMENGDYIRLRNVSLGYTFPKKLVDNLKISNLRIYVAAQNPLTITDYTGFDPEIGGNGLSQRGLDRGNYPVTSQFRGGVQLKF